MKKLFLEILVLLLVAGAIMIFLDDKFKDYRTEADIILQRFHLKKDSIQTIMIGNSHIGALPEDQFGIDNKAINLASPNMDFFRAYTILRATIPKCKKLKYVLLGFDYHELGHNSSLQGENYIDRQFYKYTDTLYLNSTVNLLIAKSNFFRSNRDIKYLFQKEDIYQGASLKDPPGRIIPVNRNEKVYEKICQRRALEHSKIMFMKSIIPENAALFGKIIALCKANNVDLIIINPPKSSCYKSSFYLKNYMLAKSKMDSLLKDQKYYNFNDSNYFNDSDFVDADHLNSKGAKKLLDKISFN